MSRTTCSMVTLLLLFASLSIALTACSSGGAASKKPVDVEISLTDFKIEPSQTTFQPNVSYHFVVSNKGTLAHEFRIMPPVSGQPTPDELQKQTLALISATDLTPGSTKTLDYTFTQAYPSGLLEFACHTPGHYEAGMHIPITVQ